MAPNITALSTAISYYSCAYHVLINKQNKNIFSNNRILIFNKIKLLLAYAIKKIRNTAP